VVQREIPARHGRLDPTGGHEQDGTDASMTRDVRYPLTRTTHGPARLDAVVIGGSFSSTFLTLIVVPVVYSLVAGGREALSRRSVRW
jgi:hypothetical protein